jgi:isopentenyl-diphosphate delta-isomerase
MESKGNKVIVVDDNDAIIGAEYMMDAIEKGFLRRAARVYVFNQSGQLLVQKRSKNVHKPLLLDQSAGGHVDEGESYEEAAYRELSEELGLAGYPLTSIATSVKSSDFYCAIFKTIIPDNTKIIFDPEEIDSIYWYNINTLDQELELHPEKFTIAFKEIWYSLKDQILNS